ncbi:HAL/PAL/TAL family ammonia-lyase [Algihabitans sp.]|uniref:HAL/PAL/TAL family ammonia-lyase n=1 Tax=Algihabitans sp. TaxID=2821514 RepID=UPI003BAB9C66
MARTVEIGHERRLTLEEVSAVAEGAAVAVIPASRDLLAERRRQIEAYVTSTAEPAYGFNRGFGSNVRDKVDPARLKGLQVNLIRSHSVGLGDPAPVEVVRATMLLRAQSLMRGHSGVRPQVVDQLAAFLNAGITPIVPQFGSVSASGDLTPLSHVALALIGEGEVLVEGARLPTSEALSPFGLEPLELEMKEGLALNNGVQFTAAFGALATLRLERLLRTAAVATAVSAQVMLGADTPFRPDLHALRPHPGSVRLAGWIHALMAGSPLREAHRPYEIDGEIQDPYNLRCAAQILGPCWDLAERARKTLEIEINAVTDNPILLQANEQRDNGGSWGAWAGQMVEIVSGGHFHGMPVSVDIYGLLQALGILASLTNARCQRYVDADRNKGLGPQLKWPGADRDLAEQPALLAERATQSGMMLPEYATAALANWIWGQALPSHLMSLPTDSGQEDHVSMGVNVAIRAYEAMPRMAEALAVELAYASQAAALRQEMRHLPSRAGRDDPAAGKTPVDWHPVPPDARRLSPAGEAAVAAVRRHLPPVVEDRVLSGELQALGRALLDGEALEAVGPYVDLE